MVYATSFRPPALPDTDGSDPAWILLDTLGYISDCQNTTKAEANTSTHQKVMVSFFTVEPPAVSYFSVHCPGLKKEDFVTEPRVVHSENNLVLISLSLKGGTGTEYFIYRASAGHQPSLHLLPDTDCHLSKMAGLPSIAFVPYSDGEHFVLAALGLTYVRAQYEFHVFRSESQSWTHRRLVLGKSVLGPKMVTIVPTKVIMLGGGEIGWVDLWNGILVCDLFNEDPAFRVIPLPNMLPANHVYKENSSPEQFRDVICTNGSIKFVEMEYCRRRIIHEIRDISKTEVLHDSELTIGETVENEKDTYEYTGWRIITWNRTISSSCWHRGSLLHVDDILVSNPDHSVLLPDLLDKDARKNLETGFPTLSMDGRDVVYLLSKVDTGNQEAWIVTIDMQKKTLEDLAPFSAERCMYAKPDFVTCVLSKHLNTISDGADNVEQNSSLVVSSSTQAATQDMYNSRSSNVYDTPQSMAATRSTYDRAQSTCHEILEDRLLLSS